jgi:hypothetical protein
MLTDERVDAIFKEMDSYVLELVPDPTSLGPQYFRDHIAVCRNYLNRVGLVLNELSRDRLAVSGDLRKQEAAFAMDFDNLLTNEPSIKNLDSIEDRKAAAGFKLRTQRTDINTLKEQMHILDSVHKVVSYRNRELHATMTAIKDQAKLMNAEIRSGSYYGDERTDSPESRSRGSRSVVVDDISAEELAAMMSDPAPSSEAPTEPPAPEPQSTAPMEGEAEMLQFLEGGSTLIPALADTQPAAAEDEDEFASLLDGL